MGRMKEWGMKLAKMVYQDRMSDEQIIKQHKQATPTIDEAWLREQIKAVRSDPKMWRGYAERS